jgi:hypothetical protein
MTRQADALVDDASREKRAEHSEDAHAHSPIVGRRESRRNFTLARGFLRLARAARDLLENIKADAPRPDPSDESIGRP